MPLSVSDPSAAAPPLFELVTAFMMLHHGPLQCAEYWETVSASAPEPAQIPDILGYVEASYMVQ